MGALRRIGRNLKNQFESLMFEFEILGMGQRVGLVILGLTFAIIVVLLFVFIPDLMLFMMIPISIMSFLALIVNLISGNLNWVFEDE